MLSLSNLVGYGKLKVGVSLAVIGLGLMSELWLVTY